MAVESIKCLVCNETMGVKLASGRKSGKPFIMLVCPKDGRHFRAFITDQNYVKQVVEKSERLYCK
ncbi:MAG: hypothetical protein AAC990_02150 [Dehalococcoides mccartyi]|uniref:hypothetical protein n=1 Tax=Dehalococcoides mccartyi TaxID=61435 RepID=UPI0030F5FD59